MSIVLKRFLLSVLFLSIVFIGGFLKTGDFLFFYSLLMWAVFSLCTWIPGLVLELRKKNRNK